MPLETKSVNTFPAHTTWEFCHPTKAHVQELENLRRAVSMVLDYDDNEEMLPMALENLSTIFYRGRTKPTEIRVINAAGEPVKYNPKTKWLRVVKDD
jgi:hypothetical protein